MVQSITSKSLASYNNCMLDEADYLLSWNDYFKDIDENDLHTVIDLRIRRSPGIKPFLNKFIDAPAISSAMDCLKSKSKKCQQCREVLSDVQLLPHLRGKMFESYEILRNALPCVIHEEHMIPKLEHLLVTEIDWSFFKTCECNHDLKIHFVQFLIKGYIVAVIKYINKIMDGKITPSIQERTNSLVESAFVVNQKKLRKKNRVTTNVEVPVNVEDCDVSDSDDSEEVFSDAA
ncbi:hypothetical protein QAD02_013047 [Eretmocerus hayati]|uniref:Uncharacterized protein n=1 Tax=Eretmocerus hayati TaxID=131215 RepID=A0ACC2P108_9HYME|nr:hypothetical protein QAD02_013047 [Eretmocerus hayati]